MQTTPRHTSVAGPFTAVVLGLLASICVLAAWLVLGPLQTTLLEGKHERIAHELEILQRHANRNVQGLVRVLRDQAQLPRIVHAVMHRHESRERVSGLLSGLRLVGRNAEYALLDYQGRCIDGERTFSFAGTPEVRKRIQKLLSGQSQVLLDAGQGPQGPFWRLAVPILYHGSVEGVLVADRPCQSLLRAVIGTDLVYPEQQLSLLRGAQVLDSVGSAATPTLTIQRPLPHSKLHWELAWDHSRLHLELRSFLFKGLAGFVAAAGVLIAGVYVFGRRRIVLPQKQLAALNDQLATQHEALERHMQNEKALEHMKHAFINIAAHELRTPLTTVQGFSELLLSRSNLGVKQCRRYAERIHGQAVTLTSLVNRIMDVSAVESGQGLQIVATPSDICQVVQETVDEVVQATAAQQRIEVQCRPCAPFCFDPHRIGSVVYDLVANAVAYSPPESPIRINGNAHGEDYWVYIADQGRGMEPEFVQNVFAGFRKADTSTTAHDGIGLSLYLAWHILRAHDGQLWVESAPGKGTTVVFALPLREPRQGTSDATHSDC